MQGNLRPDKNLVVGAAAGIVSKVLMGAAAHFGWTVDAETQGYVMVVATWGVAHCYDMWSGDNRE